MTQTHPDLDVLAVLMQAREALRRCEARLAERIARDIDESPEAVRRWASARRDDSEPGSNPETEEH